VHDRLTIVTADREVNALGSRLHSPIRSPSVAEAAIPSTFPARPAFNLQLIKTNGPSGSFIRRGYSSSRYVFRERGIEARHKPAGISRYRTFNPARTERAESQAVIILGHV
jgi:hypothetical protein